MRTYHLDFGKYAGECVADIPTSYLQWLLREQVLRGRPLLQAAVEMEVEARSRRGEGSGQSQRHAERHGERQGYTPALADEVVRRWFAKLSLRFHPDRGGSDEEMRVVNFAHELLKELLGK